MPLDAEEDNILVPDDLERYFRVDEEYTEV